MAVKEEAGGKRRSGSEVERRDKSRRAKRTRKVQYRRSDKAINDKVIRGFRRGKSGDTEWYYRR